MHAYDNDNDHQRNCYRTIVTIQLQHYATPFTVARYSFQLDLHQIGKLKEKTTLRQSLTFALNTAGRKQNKIK